MNELQRIVARTRGEVTQRREARPLADVRAAAADRAAADPLRPFADALARPGLSVIAEHKRRSPSAGLIREGLALEDVVGAYERGGAAALSVLTEQVGFGGTLDDLRRARAASTLPILRKDFIIDPYQVTESVAAGADAILLIVAALDPDRLARLYAQATDFGLGVLVEVHGRRRVRRGRRPRSGRDRDQQPGSGHAQGRRRTDPRPTRPGSARRDRRVGVGAAHAGRSGPGRGGRRRRCARGGGR